MAPLKKNPISGKGESCRKKGPEIHQHAIILIVDNQYKKENKQWGKKNQIFWSSGEMI